jgi:hypothetical protein
VHELLHDVRLIVSIGINIKNKTNGIQYKTGTQGVSRKRGPSSATDINTLTVPTNADTRQLVSLPCRLLRRASVPLPRTSDRLFSPLKSGQSMPLVPILRVWSIMRWELSLLFATRNAGPMECRLGAYAVGLLRCVWVLENLPWWGSGEYSSIVSVRSAHADDIPF